MPQAVCFPIYSFSAGKFPQGKGSFPAANPGLKAAPAYHRIKGQRRFQTGAACGFPPVRGLKIIFYIACSVFLSELYLFKWTADRLYLFVWVVIAILAYFKQYSLATSLVIGCLSEVLLNQFVGDYIRNLKIQSITENMTQEHQAMLHLHPGVEIWILTILTSFAIGIIITIEKKRELQHDK